MNNLWYWKEKEIEETHEEDVFEQIEQYQTQEEGAILMTQPQPPQRKRTREEGSSRDSQAQDENPPWVGQIFDRLSLVETNFNSRLDHLRSHFDSRLDHLEYDVHYLYYRQGYECQYAPFS